MYFELKWWTNPSRVNLNSQYSPYLGFVKIHQFPLYNMYFESPSKALKWQYFSWNSGSPKIVKLWIHLAIMNLFLILIENIQKAKL